MGKLHSIRRAIERDPDKWRWYRWTDRCGQDHARKEIAGAEFNRRTGQWEPCRWPWYPERRRPYYWFVVHVLNRGH